MQKIRFIIIIAILTITLYGCNYPKKGGVTIDYQNQDISSCDRISVLSIKADCVKNFAIKLNDKSQCNRLEPQSAEQCKKGYKQHFLKYPSEKNDCYDYSSNEEEKNICLYSLAIKNNDSSVCDSITNKNISTECISFIKNRIQY